MPALIPGPGQDVIPANDAAALAWLQNLGTEFTASAETITAPLAVTFAGLVTTFASALATASNPDTRTSVTVAAKGAAKATAAVMARDIVRQLVALFRSGVISSATLETYGVRIPDLVPTNIPAPITAPLLAVISAISGQQQLRASDSSTPDSRKKPFGATGLEIWRSSAATPPANGEGSEFIGTFSRQPMIVMSPAGLKGSPVHYFGRWVTARGLVGPWSLAASFVGT